MAVYSPGSLGINAPSEGFSVGGWYSGRQYWGGTLGEPGEFHPESDQARAGQTQAPVAPENQSYIEQERIKASQLQPTPAIPTSSGSQNSYLESLSGSVDTARKAVEDEISRQKAENEAKMLEARKKEQETFEKIEPLTKPFREDLEKSERERLYVNKNFEENQKLVDELEQLLNEGNEYIKQQKEITGLAAVRNPRIQKAIDDVAARVGVIEAVINARNGQIAQAYNMIDRSINAIVQDRQDQINYYTTILKLNERDIISLDNDSKVLAQETLNLKKGDLERAEATANYVKELLIDPTTAHLMADAGVSLNDSVEQISIKLADAQYRKEVRDMVNDIVLGGGTAVVDPSSVPTSQLRSFTDSRGQVHYYKISKSSVGTTDITASDYLVNRNVEYETDQTSTGSPQFSPAEGMGAVWVDPTTGDIWQYTKTGWKKIG